jgi:hypothetical protein
MFPGEARFAPSDARLAHMIARDVSIWSGRQEIDDGLI